MQGFTHHFAFSFFSISPKRGAASVRRGGGGCVVFLANPGGGGGRVRRLERAARRGARWPLRGGLQPQGVLAAGHGLLGQDARGRSGGADPGDPAGSGRGACVCAFWLPFFCFFFLFLFFFFGGGCGSWAFCCFFGGL